MTPIEWLQELLVHLVPETDMNRIPVMLSLLLLGSCSSVRELTMADAQVVVLSQDRLAADRAFDAERKPIQLLQFAQVGSGMRVGELVAGEGYTTELLSLAVGSHGVVYAENPDLVVRRFAGKAWSERLMRLPNVRRIDRELDAPFSRSLSLDVVVSNNAYHHSNGADRKAMNNSVYFAIKSGGRYVICDAAARRGAGARDMESLHRTEEMLVRDEVSQAGFRLEAEGNFLRNPADTHDGDASPSGAADPLGPIDRFCLRFVRP